MMRRASLPLAVAALALLISCQSDNLTRSIDGPMYAVSDGAHAGNPDFFFLSPLFQNPNSNPNYEPAAFNGALRPAVEICELGAPAPDNTRECITGAPIKRFAPGSVTVSDQQYHVNWNTDESNLNVTKLYRIEVFVGSTLLGFADIDPVSSGKDLKNVQTGEYIGLVDGRTLPIKFRIEDGALCATDGTPCAAQTINLAQGGGIELVIPGEDFHFDIRPGTQATTPGGQVVTEVTFNVEVCDGIDIDLPKVGLCLRVTALYDAAGTALNLSLPALISMCSFTGVAEGQRALITLHQQDGDLIRALPHAHPNCDVIGAHRVESSSLAARSWHWIRDLAAKAFIPRPLYARTRMAVLHLGAGGETNRLGATCTPPASAKMPVGMALATCAPAVAQLTPFPTSGHTISDFQFALPAKMTGVEGTDGQTAAPGAPVANPPAVFVSDLNDQPVEGATVRFVVTAGGGALNLGSAVPCGSDPAISCVRSDENGIARVASWTLGSLAGTNLVTASGHGIAAANNFPTGVPVKPFMPDISSETPQTPVTLGTGEITFLATGGVPTIDFEAFASGAPACSLCDVTDQFRARGLEFAYESFDHIFTGGTLGDGTVLLYGDAGNRANHFVTSAVTESGAGISGHLTMTLVPPYPTALRFDLSTAEGVAPPINVFPAGGGSPIPDAQIARTFVRNYTNVAGAPASWTTIDVSSEAGIQRVVFIMTSFIQQIDNVGIQVLLPQSACSLEPTLRSTDGTVSTSVRFINQTAGPVTLYWLDYAGQRIVYNEGIPAGQAFEQQTYLTHPWVVTDATGACLGIWLPSAAPGTATITAPVTP